jgi:hypothetical protein
MAAPAFIKKWKEGLRDKDAMARLRAKAKEKAEGTVETAAVVGGGALAGYIEASYPDKEVFGVNAGLAAGAVLTVVGLMGYAGKSSHIVGSLGEGMLAYEAGRRVAKAQEE